MASYRGTTWCYGHREIKIKINEEIKVTQSSRRRVKRHPGIPVRQTKQTTKEGQIVNVMRRLKKAGRCKRRRQTARLGKIYLFLCFAVKAVRATLPENWSKRRLVILQRATGRSTRFYILIALDVNGFILFLCSFFLSDFCFV